MNNHRDDDREQRVRIDLNVNINGLHGEQSRPQWAGEIVTLLTKLGAIMSKEFDAVKAEVARNTEIDRSVMALVKGMADRIEALKTDPVALQAFADELRASNDAVQAAVVANTPAEPPA